MVARRAVTIDPDDPLETAMLGDREQTATDLIDALDAIRSLSGTGITVLVYKIAKSGKWEYCVEKQPPIDTTELIVELKGEYGPGDYALRVRAEGKIKTTKYISVAGGKSDTLIPRNGGGMGGDMDIIRMMMEQGNNSRSEQMQMFMLMMQNSSKSSEQMQALMQASSQQTMTMMTALISGLMGNKESPTALLAQLADIQTKLNPDKSHTLTETVETLKVLKDFAGGGDGGSEKDFFGRAMDALPALMEGVGGMMRGGGLPMVGPAQPQSFNGTPPAPMVTHAPSMLVEAPAEPEQPIPPPSNRVLAIIKDDVLFYFKRQSDPEFAAEGIVNTLMQNEVTQDELSKLIVQFQSSPDLLGELAAQGIDLRSNPVWVNITLAQVVSEYSARLAEDNDSGGKDGSHTDPANNGATG